MCSLRFASSLELDAICPLIDVALGSHLLCSHMMTHRGRSPMASSPPEVSWQERCGAFLFTVVGDYLDAYAYIAHGGVFANAQTGNIVLLAVNIAEAHWMEALRHLLPILTFSAATITVDPESALGKTHQPYS